ncbi:MAG: hypothetical protein AABM64_18030 [Pseudomonadota bacterium]
MPALRRLIRASIDPAYRAELARLKDPEQTRKGRLGGLTRALRAGQNVSAATLARVLAGGWRPPFDVAAAAARVTRQQPTP